MGWSQPKTGSGFAVSLGTRDWRVKTHHSSEYPGEPAGEPAGAPDKEGNAHPGFPGKRSPTAMKATFLFATGIENSYPTLDGGRTRVDEMEKCGHYDHWRTDFDRVQELGIS